MFEMVMNVNMAGRLIFNSFLLSFLIASVDAQSGKDAEKRLLLHSETDNVQEIINIKNTIIEMEKNFTTLLNKLEAEKTKEVNMLSNKLNTLENETRQLKLENGQLVRSSVGSTYVRWGRNVCPASAQLVYKGYTAGKHYTHKGGTDTLCLPDDPSWSNYVDGDNTIRGYVFGAELEVYEGEHIFKDAVQDEDMPCAVCRSKRSSTIMIPGRNSCYGNWTAEYEGYLMSAYYDHYGISHVCVDQSPEFIPSGAADTDGHLLYFVEARCGALPCPPYVEGRELACVVCSN